MRLRFLGKCGSDKKNCPTLYATDQRSFLVQGWKTDRPEAIEIPHVLLGYIGQEGYLGTSLVDTGRGTFVLAGRPVTDAETLGQLTMEDFETAIEVPRAERVYFGGISRR
ncbi:hypothetical protein [Nocardia terpenica]|uniref:Uncharacterized protein n=1 Tax=Nocardia terpenica TaxID=455432 RepID=A0A6G9Z2K2_9NOCA|nr:hypothetical protein [Nocardia terpenica]QIS19426.1 hypothetical protein F6W96_15185 [Nocardia terpenica]